VSPDPRSQNVPGSVAAWLDEMHATNDLVAWAAPLGSDFSAMWATCPRGDWMLAIAARAGASREHLALAASACARSSAYVLPDEAAGALAVLDEVEAWARGERPPVDTTSIDERVDAFNPGDPAVATALEAIRSAARSAGDPDAAALAAANAAECAVHSVGDCAMMPALREAQQTCARHVRAAIPFEQLRFG
jgi:hypothetical protein